MPYEAGYRSCGFGVWAVGWVAWLGSLVGFVATLRLQDARHDFPTDRPLAR